MSMNNCVRPPHFPPHCGCPAGSAPAPELPTTTTEEETS